MNKRELFAWILVVVLLYLGGISARVINEQATEIQEAWADCNYDDAQILRSSEINNLPYSREGIK